ncbi:hypothetical protein ABW19_dt0201582 [Dactylella cylindrospora]|nr:hypothetical protein ABW19_dt0201582 [Dactylella cylindrospora]
MTRLDIYFKLAVPYSDNDVIHVAFAAASTSKMPIILSIFCVSAVIWFGQSIYSSRSLHYRRHMSILATILFMVLIALHFSTFSTIKTTRISHSPPSTGQSNLVAQIPFRPTSLTIDHATDSSKIQKHTFITKYHNPETPPSILLLIPTKDDSSWGKNRNLPPRRFSDFLKMVGRQMLLARDVSIGLLTADIAAVESYTSILMNNDTDIPIATIDIIYAPGSDFTINPSGYDGSARLRNYLLNELVGRDHRHVIFIDPDVYFFPPGVVEKLIGVSETNTQKLHVANLKREGKTQRDLLDPGLVAVMTRQERYEDLRRNGWSGPTKAELKEWQGEQGSKRLALPQPMSRLIDRTTDESIVRLDGVGESLLYIRADLIRQGLRWPSSNEVDSLGLCQLAKELKCGCYGLGGSWETRHTNS